MVAVSDPAGTSLEAGLLDGDGSLDAVGSLVATTGWLDAPDPSTEVSGTVDRVSVELGGLDATPESTGGSVEGGGSLGGGSVLGAADSTGPVVGSSCTPVMVVVAATAGADGSGAVAIAGTATATDSSAVTATMAPAERPTPAARGRIHRPMA